MVTGVELDTGRENDIPPSSMSDDVIAWILESMGIRDSSLLERVRKLELTLVPGEPIHVALDVDVYHIDSPLVDWSKGLERCPVAVKVVDWVMEKAEMWDGEEKA